MNSPEGLWLLARRLVWGLGIQRSRSQHAAHHRVCVLGSVPRTLLFHRRPTARVSVGGIEERKWCPRTRSVRGCRQGALGGRGPGRLPLVGVPAALFRHKVFLAAPKPINRLSLSTAHNKYLLIGFAICGFLRRNLGEVGDSLREGGTNAFRTGAPRGAKTPQARRQRVRQLALLN